MLTLLKMRKSSNPNAQVDSKTGLNVTSDGRLYYIAEFSDPTNPFAPTRVKMISQQKDSQGNFIWKGGDPEVIKNYVGKQIAATTETHPVEDYDVNGRVVSTYTAVVFQHENVETVFRNAGHPIVNTVTGEVKTSSTELNIKTISEKTEPIAVN